MKVSKNHHYVPQAILRHFCISGDTILRLERSSELQEPEPKNIEKVFQRCHLNNFERRDGTKGDSLEKFFGREFDHYIPSWIEVFREALRTGELDFDSDENKNRFIQFFYNHMKRTPDFIDPIVTKVSEEVLHDNLAEEYEREHRALSAREKSLLDSPEWRRTIISNSRVSNLSKQSERVLNLLASMKIYVATPTKASKQFIISSKPVVRFEDYPKQKLGTPGVELWACFTPRIAVGFSVPSTASSVLLFDDALVRKMNLGAAIQSKAIAGNSAKLLRSVARAAW